MVRGHLLIALQLVRLPKRVDVPEAIEQITRIRQQQPQELPLKDCLPLIPADTVRQPL